MMERKDPWSVGAWMTPNPATVSPDTLARDAFFTMRRDHYRHLLVVEDGRLIGIVTDRDLRRPTITEEPDGWNDYYQLDAGYTVRDVMSDGPATVHVRDRLEKALKLLIERKIGALPVLDKNDGLFGILTTYDALRAFQQLLDEVGDTLRS